LSRDGVRRTGNPLARNEAVRIRKSIGAGRRVAHSTSGRPPFRAIRSEAPGGSRIPSREEDEALMSNGTVKFFHDKKGWGFIEGGKDEDIFVHYADIVGDGHRTLAKGEQVQFDVIKGPKGNKAVNVIRVMSA
jgi:CspA family cold shock protein